MRLRERLLLWWGRRHIGETIRRRAVHGTLRVHLRSQISNLKLLDAGCGRGDNALWVARRWPRAQVDAVDMDPALVALVERRAKAEGVRNMRAVVGDVCEFQISNFKSQILPQDGYRDLCKSRHCESAKQSHPHQLVEPCEIASSRTPRNDGGGACCRGLYAIIYSVDVFEHLKDPVAALRHLASFLAPGGAIVLHVPRLHQRRFFKRFAHYEQHDHEREGFAPNDIERMAAAAGLCITTMRHTFGPPGALAWELFHLAQGVGKWCALLTYPVPWVLAQIDGWVRWRRGNGMLVTMQKNIQYPISNTQ